MFHLPRKCIFSPILNKRSSSSVLGFRDQFSPFDVMVDLRRKQAKKSIVVQVNSESSFDGLYSYCNKFGQIEGIHHYALKKDNQNFMVVEFKTEDDLCDLMKNGCIHKVENDVMPISTPYMWFRVKTGQTQQHNPKYDKTLQSKHGTDCKGLVEIFDVLRHCENVSQQMEQLYQMTCLNDLGIRLRFLVARQLDVVFGSLYSNIAVTPFGSSINGFGKMGCDLDLILNNRINVDKTAANESRLIYHTKKSGNTGGTRQWQRHMELLGDLLQLYVPGCSHIRRILQARVPIIKFNQDFTGVECDLTVSNMSAVYMSEMLYIYSCYDPRVRPLVFTVKHWAHCVGLTSSSPGRWITNFSLTLMVIFFLQQKGSDGALLPPLKYLEKHAEKSDVRITEDHLNCTFARDIRNLPSTDYTSNENDLEKLLFHFFEFYAQFDFRDKAISINEGVALRKTNHTALYIVNPLEQSLNVSRNVSFEECEKLKIEVRNAAWHFESRLDKSEQDSKSDWGLLKIFQQSGKTVNNLLKVGNSHRLLSVVDLYKEEVEQEASQEVKFRNADVEKQVKQIRHEKRNINRVIDNVLQNGHNIRKR